MFYPYAPAQRAGFSAPAGRYAPGRPVAGARPSPVASAAPVAQPFLLGSLHSVPVPAAPGRRSHGGAGRPAAPTPAAEYRAVPAGQPPQQVPGRHPAHPTYAPGVSGRAPSLTRTSPPNPTPIQTPVTLNREGLQGQRPAGVQRPVAQPGWNRGALPGAQLSHTP